MPYNYGHKAKFDHHDCVSKLQNFFVQIDISLPQKYKAQRSVPHESISILLSTMMECFTTTDSIQLTSHISAHPLNHISQWFSLEPEIMQI